MWKNQVEYFSRINQVIIIDLRGYGKSSIPQGKYSHHEDVKALLDFLKVKRTHLAGLSLGGEICIDFTLTYPNNVQSLILMDTSLGGYKSTVDWNVYAKDVGLIKAEENWENHVVFSKTRQNKYVWSEIKKIILDYSGWHWLNKDTREKLSPLAKERLREIKNPTLILVGEKDLKYFHDITIVLNNNIKNARLQTLKNCGHMVNMEKSNEVNILIKKFIKQTKNFPKDSK